MQQHGKATRIRIFSFDTPAMRAFHFAWLAFFVSFIGWFAIAPLMPVIREELHLTPSQVGNIIVASVAITIFARIAMGWLCDRYGPRLVHSCLLWFGAIPVMGIGLSHGYTSFLLFRLAIGAIGASFVLTQYHTSAMFAPNCVGTANAAAAGWGNMGGGVAQIVMPAIFAGLLSLGFSSFWAWRVAMIGVGALLPIVGTGYYFLTQDTPDGNLSELRKAGTVSVHAKPPGSLGDAARNPRVWALALGYGACFGLEITTHNIAALYFTDQFKLGLQAAGLVAGSFGMLAIFARALGGYMSDRVAARFGLLGRTRLLALALMTEGTALAVFSQTRSLSGAIAMLVVFGLFVHISCGATYGIVPFVDKRSIGSVAGLIGAGGNAGAVASGFLFKGAVSTWPHSMTFLAGFVALSGCCALLLRFAPEAEAETPQPLVQSDSLVASA